MVKRKTRIGVIFGGKSGEHEISLISAQSVMRAIDRERYQVVPIGITKDGRWLTTGDPLAVLTGGHITMPKLLSGETIIDAEHLASEPGEQLPLDLTLVESEAGQEPEAEGPQPETRQPVLRASEIRDRDLIPGTREAGIPDVDVIFPVLHGPFGEDGAIQGLLELADIPYVGAGVLASAVGMDKVVMKDVFAAHGLPVVPYLAIKRRDWERDPAQVMERIVQEIGLPCFVKPANLGSSVGISKAHDITELDEALAEAAQYDRKLLVEVAVPQAREIECSVLGNDDPIASVPGEVIPSREFYDYAAKYLDRGEHASQLLIPAPIPDELAARVRELAIKAYVALDCAGMARADFMLSRETGQLYAGEVNTIPGFTQISMYPKLWEATGISYPELIDRLIDLALERHNDKKRSRISYIE
jgi:D-alanine-D-alanine ligase